MWSAGWYRLTSSCTHPSKLSAATVLPSTAATTTITIMHNNNHDDATTELLENAMPPLSLSLSLYVNIYISIDDGFYLSMYDADTFDVCMMMRRKARTGAV